ncbi:hypothetical protein JCM10207_007685 [Rhodosporidiobolus poonsookiae]
MHSPLCTVLALVALAAAALASPPSSPSTHTAPLSRRNGPLAKQRLQKRASTFRTSSPAAKRTGLPMLEGLDEAGLLAAAAEDDELARRGLLGAVPGGSVLKLVSLEAILGSLTTTSSSMNKHEQKIKSLAAQARKYKKTRKSSEFQNSVYQELKAYRGCAQSLPGLREIDAALKPLAGDQGLDNFNRADPLQVAIRTVNESAQNTLEAVNLIVFNIPTLGAPLGILLYDIKCILDDLLNISQLHADGLLNELAPALRGLTMNYSNSICEMAPSLAVC